MDDTATIRVLLFSDCDESAQIVKSGLNDRYALNTHPFAIMADVISPEIADVVIIHVKQPTEDLADCLSKTLVKCRIPIIVFSDTSGSDIARRAIQHGAAAFIVDGLAPQRIEPVLEVALERYQMLSTLRKELDDARTTLNSQKTIERAKGILMHRNGLLEEQAYATMRRSAMSTRKSIVEVAEIIVALENVTNS